MTLNLILTTKPIQYHNITFNAHKNIKMTDSSHHTNVEFSRHRRGRTNAFNKRRIKKKKRNITHSRKNSKNKQKYRRNRGKIDTKKNSPLIFWLVTGTSIENGGVKLV